MSIIAITFIICLSSLSPPTAAQNPVIFKRITSLCAIEFDCFYITDAGDF